MLLIGPEQSLDFTALLSNPTFTALLGVILGAFGSFLVTAWLVVKQRRDAHRAAVRAVVYELTENLPKADNPAAPGELSTRTFDGLVIPLYTDLPDRVAHHVSFAYALLHATGPSVATLPAPSQAIIRDQLHTAQGTLREYAELKLGLNFDPP